MSPSMNMSIGIIASLAAAGLAVLLARETRLRRALEAICSRLIERLRQSPYRGRFRLRPSRPPRGSGPRR